MSQQVELPFCIALSGHRAGVVRPAAQVAGPADDAEAQAALRLFARAADINPHDPDYHFILGRALLDAGRTRDGVLALQKAVGRNPDSVEYRLALAEALWRLNRFEEAAEMFEAAVRLDRGVAAAWSGMGTAHLVLGRAQESLSALDEALRLDPGLGEARVNRGIALWQRGDSAGALTAFREAAGRDPERANAHHNLGLGLLAAGQPPEGLAALRTARERAPNDPLLVIDTAVALEALGNGEEARKTFRAALEMSPFCLEQRPEARPVYLALEAQALRQELTAPRPPSETALGVVCHALLTAAAPLRALFGLAQRLPKSLLLAGLALLAFPLWNLAPIYVRHYLFADDLAEVAGTPVSMESDVWAHLEKVAERRGLRGVIGKDTCQIVSVSQWRTIDCRYRVPVLLLPGWRHTLELSASVERFYVAVDKYQVG